MDSLAIDVNQLVKPEQQEYPMHNRHTALARIEPFLEKLAAIPNDGQATNLSRMWSLAANELQHLKRARWTPDGRTEELRGLTSASIRSTVQEYRTAIAADERFGPDHASLQYLRPSRMDHEKVKLAYASTLRENAKHIQGVDVDAIIDRSMSVLTDPEAHTPFTVIAALIAVTGCRNVEIIKTASFSKPTGIQNSGPTMQQPPTEENPYTLSIDYLGDDDVLLFAGKAHGKSGEITPAYWIPTLVDSSLVIHGLESVRKRYDVSSLTNKEVTARIGNNLGNATRELFPPELITPNAATITPKDFRSVYAIAAYDTYVRAEGKDISYNQFVGMVFQHNPNEHATALSYQKFAPIGAIDEYRTIFDKANKLSAQQLREEILSEQDDTKRQYLTQRAEGFESARRGDDEVGITKTPDAQSSLDITSLEVYRPRANAKILEAESLAENSTNQMFVLGRDADQTRIFGQMGMRTEILSLPKESFEYSPMKGDHIRILKEDNKITTQSLSRTQDQEITL